MSTLIVESPREFSPRRRAQRQDLFQARIGKPQRGKPPHQPQVSSLRSTLEPGKPRLTRSQRLPQPGQRDRPATLKPVEMSSRDAGRASEFSERPATLFPQPPDLSPDVGRPAWPVSLPHSSGYDLHTSCDPVTVSL